MAGIEFAASLNPLLMFELVLRLVEFGFLTASTVQNSTLHPKLSPLFKLPQRTFGARSAAGQNNAPSIKKAPGTFWLGQQVFHYTKEAVLRA
jgi:hypothetical protein